MEEFINKIILAGKDPYYPEISEEERITEENIPQAVHFEGLSKVTLKMPKTGASKTCGVNEKFEDWEIDEIIKFDGKSVAVLERNFDRHGLFAFVAEDGVVAKIKKSVGKVCSKQISHDTTYPQGYFKRLSDSKGDILAKRVFAVLGEPSYDGVVDLLPPLANPYHFLRLNEEPYRLIVKWDGSIPACFDHHLWFRQYVPLPPIREDKALEIRNGLLGGYLPAINFSYFDEEQDIGWEEIAFTLEDDDLKSHLHFRIRVYEKGKVKDHYFTGMPAQPTTDTKAFYEALLMLKLQWDEFLSMGTKISTPEERVNDAYKAGLILAMENFEGREWPRRPKYGSGNYAKDIHNTFPPATTAVANCFLDWGFTREAKDIVRYYLTNYVRNDGTFRYYGPAPDEYGQMLEIAARCFWVTKDYVWVEELFTPIKRVFNHILEGREESKMVNPPESIYHGLILGILEADYYQKPPIYNYSNDVWCWRGLFEIGKVLVEVGKERLNKSMMDAGEMFLRKAEAYRKDILASIKKTYNKSSRFLPVIVGIKEPYPYMNVDMDASYANYHLYPDLLYADFLDEKKATSVIRFREEQGGELLGTTRFSNFGDKKLNFMDDWPATGYGWAFINFDFIDKLLMLYYGHMAHHQNRGTFLAYEGVSFIESSGKGRLVTADHCIPATLVVPHLTRLMLVFEERDRDVVWLNKAAPRRWFEDGKKMSVKEAVTRFGNISYVICSKIARKLITSELTLPDQGFKANIQLMLRPPNGYKIRRVQLNGEEWTKFDAKKEVITIPKGMEGKIEIEAYY